MKNVFRIVLLSFVFISCGENETPVVSKSSSKQITSFIVNDIRGIVNETNKTITLNLFKDTDLTALKPTIGLSPKATINPASEATQDFTNEVIYTVTAEDESTTQYLVRVSATCADEDLIHSFEFDGKTYELIKMNRSWNNAALCAIERGGYLAEINSMEENEAIFNEITTNATINAPSTVSGDGGLGSYIWLGANDTKEEGVWIWDGDNDGNGIQFWQGDITGTPTNDLFNNWGKEPDNFNEQDGLGLGITHWPIATGTLGMPSQWNDIDVSNTLYYLIEFD